MRNIILMILLFSLPALQVKPETGLRDRTPQVYALIHGKIHTLSGSVIENGVIIIRGKTISDVGDESLVVPPDARIVDLFGKEIYPGFIDMYFPVEMTKDAPNAPDAHWNKRVHPEYLPDISSSAVSEQVKSLRKAGFTSALITCKDGIFRGSSQFVNLNDEKSLLPVTPLQWVAFEHGGWGDKDYPGSLLGSIALIRQTFYDAGWYGQAWDLWNAYPRLNTPPEKNRALETLNRHLESGTPEVFVVKNAVSAMRAIKIAEEFDLNLWLLGSGYEYRRVPDLKERSPFIILPLNFPEAPEVSVPETALDVSLRAMRHWDLAPDNPRILAENEIPFAITSGLLENRNRFRRNMIRAVQRGLNKTKALESITTIPAKRLNVDHILGTIQEGKLANLTISDGDYFSEDSKVIAVWVEGKEFEIEKETASPKGKWQLTGDGLAHPLHITLRGDIKYLSGKITVDSLSISLKKVKYKAPFLFFTFPGDDLPGLTKGVYRFSGTLDGEKAPGELVDPGGKTQKAVLMLVEKETKDEMEKTRQPEKPSELTVRYPDGAYGRKSPPQRYDDLIIRNAEIWTCGEDGILPRADIRIQGGKFVEIGQNLKAGKNTVIIDVSGKVVTPGLIDCHSHTALSAVNEGTQSITSEVRIKDVINPDDITIYRGLAGGLTAANLLHGSANAIGGQNAVIKLRWGANAQGLIMEEAPEGIKFALGENVKQSNWGDKFTTRYPQTRMGVDQIIRDAFHAAEEYAEKWEQYHDLSPTERRRTAPPRRDLELDALSEILNGLRQVHCHSYRQDEILNLIRIADDFQFTIGVFQHVLEGYKVAEAIAEHGAGASTFSDWWAYKFEVYDAIPYNAALMHEQGVLTSLNSDSGELARRMNLEAAKAVKYGNVSREDALKMVTLYPAQQLKIDDYVGSIEPGKDADFAVWSGDPLSVFTVCEQTWIDGRKYFDLNENAELEARDKNERNTLIQKILSSPDKDGEPGEKGKEMKYREHSCGTEVIR